MASNIAERAAPSQQKADVPLGTLLPAIILERLAREGVLTIEDWRALGRKRLLIWGVTRKTARRIDILARVRP